MSHHYPAPNFEPQQGEPSLNLADRRALPNVDRRAVMELLGPSAAEPFGLGALYVDEVRPCLNYDFRTDVLRGLASRPRAIPSRWFYDHRGSQLFEKITALPEYYPTRAERAILAKHAGGIAALAGLGRVVVEFGSGSSSKTPLLLSALNASAYIPIDISGGFLWELSAALSCAFPKLPIYPIEGDFTQPLSLPATVAALPKLGFFPGSTIGNLSAPAAVDLLRAMATTLQNGMLLIGIDRIKEVGTLLPAYDDARGVTAEFNLNLLHRINRELGGTIPVDAFRHQVRWDETQGRIEMHLEAVREVGFVVGGRTFSIAKGETIHTENSFKYGYRDAKLLLRAGGWTPIADWSDDEGLFSLILAEGSEASVAP